MAVDWTMKQHDLLPELEATLEDSLGAVPNLTGATIRFIMTNKVTGVKKVDALATIVGALLGTVKYVWILGDTDTAGSFRGEFEVKYADSRLESFPNAGYINMKIVADLGGVVQP